MRSIQIRYLLMEGLGGLIRRRLSGSVAIMIMGAALLTLSIFSLVTINLDSVLQSLRGEIDVVVYLEDDIHPEDQARLHRDLAATNGVQFVSYLGRDQALERFRVELGDDAELLDALHENPLPASFELSLSTEGQDADRVRALTTMISGYPGVEEVVAQIDWVQRLDQIARTFTMVTLVIGLIVLVSSVFVISNTVRLTVEERADQIEIMKLVGATNAFIRTPFVLTGGLQGLVAGIIAMVVLVSAHGVVTTHLPELFFFGRGQLVGFTLLSAFLGALGSLLALRRHLKL
jgi:cell division transport system permease protein